MIAPGLEQPKYLKYDPIASTISKTLNISIDEMKSETRKRIVVEARWIAMHFLTKEYPGQTVSIGKYFNKDHSSICHANKMIEEVMPHVRELRYKYELCRKALT